MKVYDANDRLLFAKTVDPPDPLLYAHGIPGHVIVDERAAELKIQAFRCRIGAQEKLGFLVPKPLLDFFPPDNTPGAVVTEYLSSASGQA